MRGRIDPLVLSRTARLLAAVTLLGGVGVVTSMVTPRAAAGQFSDDEQKIANLLPQGFAPSQCSTASNPPPPLEAVASLQCTASAGPGGLTTGRFTLWPDAESMNDQFQTQALGSAWFAPTPCPGVGATPGNWSYTETPDIVAGQLLCGSFQGAPNVEWTRNSQLLTLDVAGGTDIEKVFQWWAGSGNPGGGPVTGVLA